MLTHRPQSQPVCALAGPLTAATQRKCGSQGEQTKKPGLRGLLDWGGDARPTGNASHREIYFMENGGIERL